MSKRAAYSDGAFPLYAAATKSRAPSRCNAIPRLRASVETRRISSKSNVWPCRRRTGDSIEITPTSVATRPEAVRASAVSISVQGTVAFPGASGMSVSSESCAAPSPVSL